ncbi:MAG: glycosyltransferase family 4 protein [Flavobacterium sp.]
MKILFLTLAKITTLEERGIYTDLLRKFRDAGDEIYVVSPIERREKQTTNLVKEGNVEILRVKTLNIQKVKLIEKGLATLTIEHLFLRAIKTYFSDIKFDLVLYSTPPITFTKVISYVKKKDDAYSYLLLKDIFPQNAVDIKMIRKNSLIHRFFLAKEKKLYQVSDTIGCLSPANYDFLFQHNRWLTKEKVEVNPNTIEPITLNYSVIQKQEIITKYNLPENKRIFVYGGNLGKPQGLEFLLETIAECKEEKAFFLIVGSGTEYEKINTWFQTNQPTNAKLLKGLPKNDYDLLLSACEVGLVFLHKDFTIPNFPSRLLSYLEMKMPVISATDPNTDIGDVIEQYQCGYKVLSGDGIAIQNAIKALCHDEEKFAIMKENAWQLLQKEYTVEKSYQLIANRFNSKSSNV